MIGRHCIDLCIYAPASLALCRCHNGGTPPHFGLLGLDFGFMR